MEKKNESEVKTGIVTGASSTIGAAVGVVGGTFISQELQAAELEDEGNSENVTPEPQPTPQPEPQPTPQPEPQPTPQPEPQPEPEPEPEIEVIGYETVQNPDGTYSDVAYLEADGQTVLVVDGDRDGMADVMASDLNHNNQLDEGELVDLSGEQVAMQPLKEACLDTPDSVYYAQNTIEPDYVNDANIDSFMA